MVKKRHKYAFEKTKNPVHEAWLKKYNKQTEDIKRKIDTLYEIDIKERQLKVIKRKKPTLEIGDVFVLSPVEGIYFYGKVLETNINSLNKDGFVHGKNVVFIFNCRSKAATLDAYKPDYSNLLIRPAIVDISYWRRGYFYNVGNVPLTDEEKTLDYGFLNLGVWSNWFCKANGEVLKKEPKILGVYGITTITGIANEVQREIIINPSLLED